MDDEMSRTIARLTLDHLAELPVPCRSCLFWERDPVRRAQVTDPAAEKEAWLSHVLREWGSCGRVVLVDGAPVGYVTYAPEAFVPGSAAFPTAPVSPDAVLMTTAYVVPEARGGGLGRMLVQGMARDLVTREIRAVEAFGDTRGATRGAAACVLPVEFLGSVGFKTQRAHGTTPRMRMDLRTTVTWRSEVEAAWERLRGVVRPSRAPEATPRSRLR
jgi:GNAT superfamily N-acetyltransferase